MNALLADPLEGEVATEQQISGNEAVLRFLLAGNAYFTLRSKKTGTRYTYRLAVPHKAHNPHEVWWLTTLVGENNESDYVYLGAVRKTAEGLCLTTRQAAADVRFKGFSWFFIRLLKNGDWGSQMEFYHAGRCARCGRLLTVPESIKTGFGPECAGKVFS